MRLAGDDPASAPLIDPNFLGDDRDLAAMLSALRVAREIGTSPAFNKWRAREALPGPDVKDTAELRNYLRRDADPYNHPVGTCRIGTDPAAVVDPQLRVHSIDRLRIADASVMPAIPGANTHAAVLAIAERATTLISQDSPAGVAARPRSGTCSPPSRQTRAEGDRARTPFVKQTRCGWVR